MRTSQKAPSRKEVVRSSEKDLKKKVKLLPNKVTASSFIDGSTIRPSQKLDIPERGYGFANQGFLTTHSLQQCCALILHDPEAKQTGLAHINHVTSLSSIDTFIDEIIQKAGHEKLQVYVVGGSPEFDCPISKGNEKKVFSALRKHKDLVIVGWDARGKAHYSGIAFDIQKGEICGLKGTQNFQRYDKNGTVPVVFNSKGLQRVVEYYNPSKLDIMTAKAQERWRCIKLGGKKKYSPTRALYQACLKKQKEPLALIEERQLSPAFALLADTEWEEKKEGGKMPPFSSG